MQQLTTDQEIAIQKIMKLTLEIHEDGECEYPVNKKFCREKFEEIIFELGNSQ